LNSELTSLPVGGLASLAEMRSPLADDNADDGCLATTAFFSLSAINSQRFVVGTGFAFGVQVVSEAGSSVF
jgi:hypothetical protein